MVGGGTRVSSFFPVRDLSQALEHYRALGFDVTYFNQDQETAKIECSGIVVHLVTQSAASPAGPPTVVHILVGGAHGLAVEWSQRSIEEGGLGHRRRVDAGSPDL